MITSLIITFEKNEKLKISSSLAPYMQGVLMENIKYEYGEKLHISQLHPYSQYVLEKDGCLEWHVNALDDEASENICGILYSKNFTGAEIRHRDVRLEVKEKRISRVSLAELLDRYYINGEGQRYVRMRFVTPTSFKSNGKYVIFPTSRLILSSLANKYDSVSEDTKICDDSLFEYISEKTDIVEYDLRSYKFLVEGSAVPAFVGSVKLRFGGNKEFVNLMNMLADLGQYSGVGIKASMGMGAVRL